MWKVFPGSTVASCKENKDQQPLRYCILIKCLKTGWDKKNQTSMLVAFSFSSITCFRMVKDDLMASFNVMDCKLEMEKGTKKDHNSSLRLPIQCISWVEISLIKYLNTTDWYTCIIAAILTWKHANLIFRCSCLYLVVDLLQGALCSLRSWADGPSITLDKSSWWVHVVPAVIQKRGCEVRP